VPKAPGVPEGPLKMKSRVVVPGAEVPDKP